MADEVEMTPVAGAEPPKADPLAKPAVNKVATLKLNPLAHKPAVGGTPTASLKPGLKLPPKPGLAAGLKLPPKPGATASALRPGLKLPTQNALKPGVKLPTQNALKPGVKLPPKPVIRKPGATASAAPLPKPVTPPAAAQETASAAPAPTTPEAPATPAPVAPVAVDAQGVGKLPTVSATSIARSDVAAAAVKALPKPMEALKSVTQKLKGITQEIPQQAILHKTGIIAESGVSDAQKEASKHKTARISLSDAMGVAPVKNEAAPMKTIRIKRPVNIPGATTTTAATQVKPAAPVPADSGAVQGPAAAAPTSDEAKTVVSSVAPASTVTQRKTLKIARPGGVAVRPGGKFGIKRPTQATTVVAKPASEAPAADAGAPANDGIADIPDIPTNVPAFSPAPVETPVSDGPAWLFSLSALVQAAACVAMGALAWFLYTNTQTQYF